MTIIRFINKYILIISFAFLYNDCCLCQEKINFIEFNVTYLQPSGSLKRNINENKIGVELSYLRQIKEGKPIFWGLSMYYNRIDRAQATLQELLDFQFVNFDYSTVSNLLGCNGKFRFYPNVYLGAIEWYVEPQLGYKWFFTNTTKTLSNDSESSDTNTEKGSLSLTYGVSTGINYLLSEATFFNMRVNYLMGLSVPYYVKNKDNEILESTLDKFDLKRSTTDILRWDIGITYKF